MGSAQPWPYTKTNELPFGAAIPTPPQRPHPMQPYPYDGTTVNANQGPTSHTGQPQIVDDMPMKTGTPWHKRLCCRIVSLIISVIGIIIVVVIKVGFRALKYAARGHFGGKVQNQQSDRDNY